MHGDQVHRLVATRQWSHSIWAKQKLPELMRELDDAEPINRVYALKAVEYITGKPLEPAAYSLAGPPAARKRQIDALLQNVAARYGL